MEEIAGPSPEGRNRQMTEERPELPREEWRRFFDNLSRQYEGSDVTVEVLSRTFGDLMQAEKLPLAYLEYDDKDDIFTVAIGGRDGRYPVVLAHLIQRPQTIFADIVFADTGAPDMPRAFDIVDAEGTQTIIMLHDPAVWSGPPTL
ncbi:DUF5335 family protein [Nonomuraea sp. CA-143628]|uniref:DUF5335 family protein n=1 Tax=Nonomuraea sp. CA-143628 TaxID=3239997 RepID=UPI003D89B4D0